MLKISCKRVAESNELIVGSSFDVNVKPSAVLSNCGVEVNTLTVAIHEKLKTKNTNVSFTLFPEFYLEVIEGDKWTSWVKGQFDPAHKNQNLDSHMYLDATTNKFIRLIPGRYSQHHVRQTGHATHELALAANVEIRLIENKGIIIPQHTKHIPPMFVRVKTMTGKQFLIDTHPSQTVDDLKQLIQDKVKIPFEEQVLIYKGKPLDSEKLLVEHHILQDSILNVARKLRGRINHKVNDSDGTFGIVNYGDVCNIYLRVISSAAELIDGDNKREAKMVELKRSDKMEDVARRALEGEENAILRIARVTADQNSSIEPCISGPSDTDDCATSSSLGSSCDAASSADHSGATNTIRADRLDSELLFSSSSDTFETGGLVARNRQHGCRRRRGAASDAHTSVRAHARRSRARALARSRMSSTLCTHGDISTFGQVVDLWWNWAIVAFVLAIMLMMVLVLVLLYFLPKILVEVEPKQAL